jgi:hypothetical protein
LVQGARVVQPVVEVSQEEGVMKKVATIDVFHPAQVVELETV